MRLLLAEDERSLSKAIVTILRKNNYEVDPVYDGQDAIDYLENGTYDGAILDIMMPRMDGLSVLKKLRAGGSGAARSFAKVSRVATTVAYSVPRLPSVRRLRW